jgi:hypothetical protein
MFAKKSTILLTDLSYNFMQKKELTAKTLGVFILLYGIFAIFQALISGNPDWIFWICYISMILIGIGTLTKNSLLIKTQLNILTIPLLLWITDFFLILIFKNSVLGITSYFFNEMMTWARLVSLEHFFLLPFGYLCFFLINKEKKSALSFSTIQLLLIFTLTRIFTSPQENINAVFHSRLSFLPDSQFYLIFLFILVFIMILITDLLISKFFPINKPLKNSNK